MTYVAHPFSGVNVIYTETQFEIINPKTPYAISKATGEFIVKYGLTNWNIIRTTSVYGFGDTNLRATQVFVNKTLSNEKFWVNSGSLLDFIYIEDLARGIIEVALSDFKEEAFHITGGRAIPLADFAGELKKYFPEIKYEIVKEIKDRPKRGTFDNTKARLLLGWEPDYSLDKGVKEYIKYVKKFNIG